MRVLVAYDSVFGNTEKLAGAIGDALATTHDAQVLKVGDVTPQHLTGIEMLIVGSPTRGFQPTPATKAFLGAVPVGALQGVRVAAFDTRISPADTGSAILSFLVKIFGYAAAPVSKRLVKKGGRLVAEPEGFIVKASEGPLKEGELERAAAWAAQLPSR